MNTVTLECVKERGKLRVRIISPGYNSNANCQFPRNIRAEGAKYKVPAECISFGRGTAGKFFYRISSKSKITKLNDAVTSAFSLPSPPPSPPKLPVLLSSSSSFSSSTSSTSLERSPSPISTLDLSISSSVSKELKKTKVPDKIYGVEDEDTTCVICLEQERTYVFIPCGHFCVCDMCYTALSPKACGCMNLCATKVEKDLTKVTCPLCRGKVDDVVNKNAL